MCSWLFIFREHITRFTTFEIDGSFEVAIFSIVSLSTFRALDLIVCRIDGITKKRIERIEISIENSYRVFPQNYSFFYVEVQDTLAYYNKFLVVPLLSLIQT